jgi:hypothetical protein
MTYFDLDSKYSQTLSNLPQSKMILNGIKLTYKKEKGTYAKLIYEHTQLDNEPNTYAVRLIGGYKF